MRSNLCMLLMVHTLEQEPKIRPKFTRPFLSLRVGSGNETNRMHNFVVGKGRQQAQSYCYSVQIAALQDADTVHGVCAVER